MPWDVTRVLQKLSPRDGTYASQCLMQLPDAVFGLFHRVVLLFEIQSCLITCQNRTDWQTKRFPLGLTAMAAPSKTQ